MRLHRATALRVPDGVPVGVLATMTMDAAMVAAAGFGGPAFNSTRIGPDVIGRWAAGLLRGRVRHRDITTEPAERGEIALGIAAHYATGIMLTQAYLLLARKAAGKTTLAGATGYGLATAVFPFAVLYPSLGYGLFGRRSGEAARIGRIMLVGHTAFGLGIGLWAPIVAKRRAR